MDKKTSRISHRHQEALDRVVETLAPYDSEGWIEYWLWELLEGRKPWPFWLPPNERLLSDLHLLRDEAVVWFSWHFTRQIWLPVPLGFWTEHVKTTSVSDAQNHCCDYQKKVAEFKEAQGKGT